MLMRHGPVALVLCLVLAAPALAGDPSKDQLIFTGASAPGVSTLSFANNAYTFSFVGDETISYVVDLSDPKVAGGMLRIHELSSDSYPIDQGGVVFRDAAGAFTYPANNITKTTLTSSSISGNLLKLNYTLNLNGSHPFRYEIRMIGKQLRVRAVDAAPSTNVSNSFAGLAYIKSTGVESPVPIRMQGALALPITMFRHDTPLGTEHWFVANTLDQFTSNASDYRIGPLISPVITADTTSFSIDTATRYEPMTNGKLAAAMDDTLVLIVSSRIRDVLLDSTAPPTPYRSLLSNRMFFDANSSDWAAYDALLDLYASLGMYNLVGYCFFNWTSSVVDPPSDASVGPDWSPAFDPDGFTAMLKHATGMGMLLGAYSAFNCLPPTAPPSASDPTQIVKDGNGVPKTYNGLGFPLLGVEASGIHALSETAQLKAAGANAIYLDIQTYGSISKGPDGGHLDQTAGSPWSKTMRQGYIAQKGWFQSMRDTLKGPLLGEGSIAVTNANMEWLYYGYVDSVQRCINTNAGADASELPAGSPLAPTNWPIIPEYEWRVAGKNQVNHGNGFYHRFFGPSDGPTVVQGDGHPIYPLTRDAMDLYLAYLITYGHAGFLITNGATPGSVDEGYVTHSAAAQTYFMTNALQSLYFNSSIIGIGYWQGGAWKSFEQVLFASETLDSFRHIPIRLEFLNGLRIYVNHGPTPLQITEGGISYTLPPITGWYAGLGAPWFVAFSAIPPGTNGNRIDYCRATGQYEYFHGRGVVSGYGSLSTPARRSTWIISALGMTLVEDTVGKFSSSFGLAPLFHGLQILPGNKTLAVGDKVGLKALAMFEDGSMIDVTTMLYWASSKPGVATVTDSGIVTAVGSGTALIVVLDLTGALMSVPAPITVTVP